MKKTIKNCINRFLDRTYSTKGIGTGAIKIAKPKLILDNAADLDVKGQSFITDLFTFRYSKKYGGAIVITPQADTTEESLAIARELKEKMMKELLKYNRFKGNKDDFVIWVSKQEKLLKKNGFYKKKG